MKTFFRLLALHRPYAGWLLLGLLLSLLTLLANVVLMSISGWFIAAMGLAGLAGISINYFTPAAIIRACAIVRTTGRYAERLITHDATLRLLSGLRVWLYGVLVPLSPTGLDRERSGGLLNRLTADIDALDNFYLCILLPAATAIIASLVFVAWLWFQSPRLAWVEASLLVLAGGLLPWLLSRAGGRASQHSREIQEQLRIDAVDALQGLGELILYGADETQAAKLSQHSQALGRAQIKSERWTSAAQAIITACAWIALWAMVVLVSPQVESGARPPAELALFACSPWPASRPWCPCLWPFGVCVPPWRPPGNCLNWPTGTRPCLTPNHQRQKFPGTAIGSKTWGFPIPAASRRPWRISASPFPKGAVPPSWGPRAPARAPCCSSCCASVCRHRDNYSFQTRI